MKCFGVISFPVYRFSSFVRCFFSILRFLCFLAPFLYIPFQIHLLCFSFTIARSAHCCFNHFDVFLSRPEYDSRFSGHSRHFVFGSQCCSCLQSPCSVFTMHRRFRFTTNACPCSEQNTVPNFPDALRCFLFSFGSQCCACLRFPRSVFTMYGSDLSSSRLESLKSKLLVWNIRQKREGPHQSP